MGKGEAFGAASHLKRGHFRAVKARFVWSIKSFDVILKSRVCQYMIFYFYTTLPYHLIKKEAYKLN